MAELEVDDHVEGPVGCWLAVSRQDVEDHLVAGGTGIECLADRSLDRVQTIGQHGCKSAERGYRTTRSGQNLRMAGYEFQLLDAQGRVVGTYGGEALKVGDVCTADSGRRFEVLEETAAADGEPVTARYRIRWL